MFNFNISEFSNPKFDYPNIDFNNIFSINEIRSLNLIEILNKNGFIVFKNLDEENYLEFANYLTLFLGNHLTINNKYYTIIENVIAKSKNKYDAYTNNLQPFHIDMRLNVSRINYITMYCLKNSIIGGETLILDTLNFINSLNNFQKLILENCYVYYTASKPVKVKLFENKCFNFNPLFKKIEFENENDLRIFNELYDYTLYSESYYKYKMTVGDLIIINNKNYFHSRTAFETNSQRKMVRTFHC